MSKDKEYTSDENMEEVKDQIREDYKDEPAEEFIDDNLNPMDEEDEEGEKNENAGQQEGPQKMKN